MRHHDQNDATEDEQHQPSPFTETLDILNQRWTLHIVRCLLVGKMRFNEIARSLGINACTLRDRLRQLERSGIVHREVVRAYPPNVEYSLTERGMALHDVFIAIEQWGNVWLIEGTGGKKKRAAKAVKIGPGRATLGERHKVSS